MTRNCDEIDTLLAGALGGESNEADRQALEDHFAVCARCRAEFGSLEHTLRDLRSLPAAPPVSVQRVGDRLVLSPVAVAVHAAPRWTRFATTALRYAAVIVLAFSAGYLVKERGPVAPPAAPAAAGELRPESLQTALALQVSRNPSQTLLTSGLLAMYDSRR